MIPKVLSACREAKLTGRKVVIDWCGVEATVRYQPPAAHPSPPWSPEQCFELECHPFSAWSYHDTVEAAAEISAILTGLVARQVMEA